MKTIGRSKALIFFTIIFALSPLFFNLILMINEVMLLVGYHSNFAENLSYFLLYFANWPSFLLKIYPYVISLDDKIVYEALGWLTPRVLIINALSWGLVGFIIGIIFTKFKK